MAHRRFAEELEHASDNTAVGTSLWFENERVRVWEISLAPGQRAPFHAHTRPYFWTCVAPGQAIQRFVDGREELLDYVDGQTKFNYCTTAEPLIHDLENAGESELRFVTVELMDGGL